jgi:hypothetical protein
LQSQHQRGPLRSRQASGRSAQGRVTVAGSSGYSGTPLAKKLGIKHGHCVYVTGAPSNYAQLLDPMPAEVSFANVPGPGVDVAHVFVTEKGQLSRSLRVLRKRLNPGAALWISWPKKSAKLATTVGEATVRTLALPLGFVDVKVCAVNEVWSGLKLVVRRELRYVRGRTRARAERPGVSSDRGGRV